MAALNDTLTPERVREILHYAPDTGVFTWLVSARSQRAGDKAGCVGPGGYIFIKYRRRLYRAHRLACLYMNGRWPADHTDHINGDKQDNRWSNLREATCSQNLANRGPQKNNTSGFKGVQPHNGKWRARVWCGGRVFDAGSGFETPEEAHVAYMATAKQLHGEFARGV